MTFDLEQHAARDPWGHAIRDHHRRQEAAQLREALLTALAPFRPVDFVTYVTDHTYDELRVRFAGNLVVSIPLPVDAVLRGVPRADVVRAMVNHLRARWLGTPAVELEPNIVPGED